MCQLLLFVHKLFTSFSFSINIAFKLRNRIFSVGYCTKKYKCWANALIIWSRKQFKVYINKHTFLKIQKIKVLFVLAASKENRFLLLVSGERYNYHGSHLLSSLSICSNHIVYLRSNDWR